MSDSDNYINSLLETAPLREAIIKDAINFLNLPEGSAGLDAGCGIGLHLPMLAEAIGENGRVVGLDMSSEFLEHAQKFVDESDAAGRITLKQGNVNNLLFDDSTFDWAWSVDCIGYAPMDLLSVLKELQRVVKPGGLIAIMAYSSQQLFPGYPELEAKLNATPTGMAPFVKNTPPEKHLLRSIHWLKKAGLINLQAKTFVDDFSAPLSKAIRKALLLLIEMRWKTDELPPDDAKLFRRICNIDSPDFILNLTDYYGFITYTMFCGRNPQ